MREVPERIDPDELQPGYKMTELGPLPEEWRVVQLGDIVRLQLGRTPARANAEYWKGGIFPWVSIRDLNGGRVIKTKERISQRAFCDVFGGNAVPAGSILLSFKLTITILDYVGLFDKLEKALAYDSEDVAGVVEGLEVLRERFIALMAQRREDYLPLAAGRGGDKAVEAVLEHFRDAERREELYTFFGELEEIYEILSPDAFLRPFLADFDALARIYQMVRGNFDPGINTDKTLLRKTADLVQAHTRSGVIREPAATYRLDETSLHALVEQDTPDVVKVFNLIKALHELVEQRGGEQPFLIPIGERAAQIAELFANRQVTTEKALAEFTTLVGETAEAEREYQESDLSREAFATFWYLRGKGIVDARPVAASAQRAFAAYPYWRTDPKAEMAVRTDLYKALIAGGTREGIKGLVDDILGDLRRA